jgi:hypothetical protein
MLLAAKVITNRRLPIGLSNEWWIGLEQWFVCILNSFFYIKSSSCILKSDTSISLIFLILIFVNLFFKIISRTF